MQFSPTASFLRACAIMFEWNILSMNNSLLNSKASPFFILGNPRSLKIPAVVPLNPIQVFLCSNIIVLVMRIAVVCLLSEIHCWFIIWGNMSFKTRKDPGPKPNKVFSHFLSNRTFIHLSTDVQELLSSRGKVRPGNRHLQDSFVGVSVKFKKSIKILHSSCFKGKLIIS